MNRSGPFNPFRLARLSLVYAVSAVSIGLGYFVAVVAIARPQWAVVFAAGLSVGMGIEWALIHYSRVRIWVHRFLTLTAAHS